MEGVVIPTEPCTRNQVKETTYTPTQLESREGEIRFEVRYTESVTLLMF